MQTVSIIQWLFSHTHPLILTESLLLIYLSSATLRKPHPNQIELTFRWEIMHGFISSTSWGTHTQLFHSPSPHMSSLVDNPFSRPSDYANINPSEAWRMSNSDAPTICAFCTRNNDNDAAHSVVCPQEKKNVALNSWSCILVQILNWSIKLFTENGKRRDQVNIKCITKITTFTFKCHLKDPWKWIVVLTVTKRMTKLRKQTITQRRMPMGYFHCRETKQN